MLIVNYKIEGRVETFGPFASREEMESWVKEQQAGGWTGEFVLDSLSRPLGMETWKVFLVFLQNKDRRPLFVTARDEDHVRRIVCSQTSLNFDIREPIGFPNESEMLILQIEDGRIIDALG